MPRNRTSLSRWLRRLVLVVTAAVVVWLLVSYVVAYRLTRRPHPIGPEAVPTIRWGTLEPFRLATADGEELGAWFIDGRPGQPVVLLLHGNGRDRGSCLEQAEILSDIGCPVLLISLRAHGDSTGEVNDFGYSARSDVAAAVAWLEQRCPDRPVVVWGRSLGSAAALFAAGELRERVAGYILECPYRDLRTAVRNRTELYLPPVADRIADAGLCTVAPFVLPDIDRISPLHAAAEVPSSVRVLVLAGAADRRARPDEARAIHAQLACPATLDVFPGADHTELHRADPARYRAAVAAFVGQCRR